MQVKEERKVVRESAKAENFELENMPGSETVTYFRCSNVSELFDECCICG